MNKLQLRNLSIAIILLSVSSSNYGQELQLRALLPGENWERDLEIGLIQLEDHCDQNLVPFNRQKMQADLKQCLHKILSEDLTNSFRDLTSHSKVISYNKESQLPYSQIDLFRHHYVEPVCNKVHLALKCLKPYRDIIDKCGRDDGKAYHQLMEVVCRRNGSRIVEFIQAGGVDCIMQFKTNLITCFDINPKQVSEGFTFRPHEVCRILQQSRECVMKELNNCNSVKPAEILHSLMEEVIADGKSNCFTSYPLTSSSNSQKENTLILSFSSAILFANIHINIL